MEERERYAAVIHWRDAGGEWKTRRKTLMAAGLYEALELALEEERGQGRQEVHGRVKLEADCRDGW